MKIDLSKTSRYFLKKRGHLKPINTSNSGVNSMIGEVQVPTDLTSPLPSTRKYIKDDQYTDLVEGTYWYHECHFNLDESFFLGFADDQTRNITPVERLTDTYVKEPFIVSISQGIGEKLKIVADNGEDKDKELKDAPVDLSSTEVNFDYKRMVLDEHNKKMLKSCGQECRATVRYGTNQQLLFFSRKEQGQDVFYIPLLDYEKTHIINGVQTRSHRIDFCKVSSEQHLWKWLDATLGSGLGVAIKIPTQNRTPANIGTTSSFVFEHGTDTNIERNCFPLIIYQNQR